MARVTTSTIRKMLQEHDPITMLTDGSGNYWFTNLGPGEYEVRELRKDENGNNLTRETGATGYRA